MRCVLLQQRATKRWRMYRRLRGGFRLQSRAGRRTTPCPMKGRLRAALPRTPSCRLLLPALWRQCCRPLSVQCQRRQRTHRKQNAASRDTWCARCTSPPRCAAVPTSQRTQPSHSLSSQQAQRLCALHPRTSSAAKRSSSTSLSSVSHSASTALEAPESQSRLPPVCQAQTAQLQPPPKLCPQRCPR